MKTLTSPRTSTSFSFYPGTLRDIPALAQINRLATQQKIYDVIGTVNNSEDKALESCTAELLENFRENDFHVLIAYDRKDKNKTPVGYASYFDTDAKRTAVVQDVFTLTSHKGTGTALDDRIKKIVAKQKALFLDVRATAASEGFYKKRGYSRVPGDHPHFYRYYF